MSESETYQVYAVKYGAMDKRTRQDNFIMTDDHAASMPLDYFVWAIVNENRTVVVDTGFDRGEAQRRGRQIDRLPAEGLAMLGIEAPKVSDVIVTHMHYDHAGTLDDFPAATFHVQESEMQCMPKEQYLALWAEYESTDRLRQALALAEGLCRVPETVDQCRFSLNLRPEPEEFPECLARGLRAILG